MHKNVKSLVKLAIVGAVWGFVYFLYVVPSLSVLFQFDFLSSEAWHERWLAFENYNWRIRSLPDVLLFSMMVLWIPLYFVGWLLFYKVNWMAFRIKPKPKTVVKRALDLKKEKPLYAKPRAMPSTIQATKYVAPKLPGQEEEEQKQTTTKSHKNVVQMIKQMAVVARKFKVEIFQHILLEGHKVPMAISTAARALMIEIVNRKDVNWSVDFNDDILASTWYSEGGMMERLAEDLIKASEALARAEPGSEVIKAICVTEGRILNAKPTVEYFKNHGIHLLVFNNGQPQGDILDFSSFLSAYFDLKEGEADPALVKLEKIPVGSIPTMPVQDATPAPQAEAVQENHDPEFTSDATPPPIDDDEFFIEDLELDETDSTDTMEDDFGLDDLPDFESDDFEVPLIDEDGFVMNEELEDETQDGQEFEESSEDVSPSSEYTAQEPEEEDKNSSKAKKSSSKGRKGKSSSKKTKSKRKTRKKVSLPRQKLKTENGDEDDFVSAVAKG